MSNSQNRGRFGEITLENLLNEGFGSTHNLYAFQHVLPNLKRSDAVIFLPENLKLCIDSKFSFLDYARLFDPKDEEKEIELKKEFKNSLKNQIKKISEDYIIDGETEIYAIMYIPSDAIYGFIQSNDDFYEQVVKYARSLNVVLTSPSTLQPIVQTINLYRINYEARKNIDIIILKVIEFQKLNDTFNKRWLNLSNAVDGLTKKSHDFNTTIEKISKKTNNILDLANENKLLKEEDKLKIDIINSNNEEEI